MTPDEFAQLQRTLTANAQEQTRLLKRIGDKVEFLGWAIVIALLILLGMSFR